jgi:hypothetical protein
MKYIFVMIVMYTNWIRVVLWDLAFIKSSNIVLFLDYTILSFQDFSF